METALRYALVGTALALPLNLIAVQTGVFAVTAILAAGRVTGAWRFRHTPMDAPVAFFVLAALVSMLATPEPITSFWGSTSFWVYLAYFPLSQALTITGLSHRLRPVLLVMVAVSTLVAFYAIAQHFFGIDWFGVGRRLMWAPGSHGERFKAVGFFYRHTTLAFTLALSLIVSAVLFIEDRRPAVRAGLAAAMSLALAAIFFTYVRMAWIGVFGALLTIGLFKSLRWVGGGLAGAAVVGAVAMTFSPTVFTKAASTFTAEGSSNRNFIWKRAIEMAADHPVTGIGYGNYTPMTRVYYDRIDPSFIVRCHAHNMYLHLWCETGPLGLLAFVLVWVCFFGALARWWRGQSQAGPPARTTVLASAGAAVCILAGSAAQDLFFDGQIFFFLIYLVAAGMAVVADTGGDDAVRGASI
ncbi:MAG: O-antigen ligase family protein [Deltaproteobacteria bacterium]|nr:O-antigen ligase family protein [Deltaproteobacteria bacterium]